MNAKEKANVIANRFVNKSVFEMDNDTLKEERIIAKKHALICVEEIVNALEITTGHCELNKIDQQEIEMDFDFWKKVKTEIESL